MTTQLDPHVRGDTFVYGFTLGNEWVGADFTGGVKFTVRKAIPESTVTSDSGAVYQASVAGGQIVITSDEGVITIPASSTKVWPKGTLYWDLEGTISGTPNVVHTIDHGTIVIVGDVTRG